MDEVNANGKRDRDGVDEDIDPAVRAKPHVTSILSARVDQQSRAPSSFPIALTVVIALVMLIFAQRNIAVEKFLMHSPRGSSFAGHVTMKLLSANANFQIVVFILSAKVPTSANILYDMVHSVMKESGEWGLLVRILLVAGLFGVCYYVDCMQTVLQHASLGDGVLNTTELNWWVEKTENIPFIQAEIETIVREV